jgi:hypothetical protein
MPTKDCVEQYYRKRFVVATLALGLIVAAIMAVLVYGE